MILQAHDGQLIQVHPSKKQNLICCGCGLAHRLEFSRTVKWRAWRDEEIHAKEISLTKIWNLFKFWFRVKFTKKPERNLYEKMGPSQ